MKRKIISLLLAVCLIAAIVPQAVFALTDTESNNVFADAQTFTPGEEITGEITENDVDVFSFTLTASGRITLDMTAYMQWHTMQLFDASGNQMWFTDGNQWNSVVGFLNKVHTFDLDVGTYYVQITGRRDYDLSWYRDTSTGTYALKTSFTNAETTETEENDTLAQANALELGGTVKGQFAMNDSIDFYKIVLPTSGRLTMDMTSYMEYYAIEMFDPNGVHLWATDGNAWNENTGSLNKNHVLDLEAGTYYLQVTGRRDYDLSWYNDTYTGNYTLKVSFVSAEVSEVEENDTLGQANALEMGDSVKGQFNLTDSIDFYKVVLTASGKLTLDMTSYMPYYAIEVLDPNATHIWATDGNAWNENTGSLNKVHVLDLEAGTYYIQVTGRRDYDLSWYNDTYTGNYTLKVSFVSAETTEVEENDKLDQSNTLVAGDVLKGQIALNDDTDFFKIELAESGRLTLDMTAYMQYHSIELHNESGTKLWYSDYNTWNDKVGYLNKVHNLDIEKGTYYIKVTGLRDHDWESYDEATGNYTLKVTFTGAEATEVEENDVLDQANPLELGGTVKGQIAMNDATDFYKVELTESGRLSLDMTAYMQYHSIVLYNESGTKLWYSDYNSWNENVGYLNEVHNLDLEKGTYYIKVTGLRDHDWESYDKATGNYTLKTSFTNAYATEVEQNDVTDEANELALDGVVKGQIAINDTHDFYKITVPTAQELKLRVTSFMQYYTVHVLDEAGKEVWKDDRNEWDADTGFRSDEFTVSLEAGFYYIKVTGYRYNSYDASTGTYILLLNHHEHAWDAGVVTRMPIGDIPGEIVHTCSLCFLTEIRQFKEGDHTWVDATCSSPMTCSDCGAIYGEPGGHTWAETSCDEPKTCEVCGETEGEAPGHTWVEATCEAPKTCSVCGETEGKALGHTYADGICTTCGQEEGKGLLGDANSDGKVNNIDAMLILQYFAGIVGEDDIDLAVCDVDGGGKVNNVDAMMVLQYFAGIIDVFPAEK